jgi:hypothetical protein
VEVEDGNLVKEKVAVGGVRVRGEEGREKTGGPESSTFLFLGLVSAIIF